MDNSILWDIVINGRNDSLGPKHAVSNVVKQ